MTVLIGLITSAMAPNLESIGIYLFFDSNLVNLLFRHICDMGIDGAVLIFLPGWNTISLLRKYLESHPRFGMARDFLILSLHSQVPREDQKLVFRPAPRGARKVSVCLHSRT